MTTEKPTMIVAVKNLSKHVTDRELRLMVAAGTLQLSMHYTPRWGEFGVAFQIDADSKDVFLVLDDPDDSGALGYHTEEQGRIVGKVFVKPVLDAGGSVLGDPSLPNTMSVSSVLSHEMLECAHDLRCNQWREGGGGEVADELCDPVESTGYAVEVADGIGTAQVVVSDFVTPAWFDPQANAGPYSYCDAPAGPFQLAPGGYMVVRTKGPGTEHQVFFARSLDEHWVRSKMHALARLVRRTHRASVVFIPRVEPASFGPVPL